MIKNSEISKQIQVVRDGLNTMSSHIWLGDLGVRAYLIKQTDQFLDPYVGARDQFKDNLINLENSLNDIGFDVDLMDPAKVAINNYMEILQLMVDLCDVGKLDEALGIFYEDRGLAAWQQYSPFVESANSFISDLKAKSEGEYKDSIDWILFIQIRLIIISIPILILTYRKIRKDNRFRTHIFDLVETSNRSYLFDDG
ncbi:MAG: CHASE3 domain-containing protein, partial [Cyclobacteriaceae bacterium]|nr:CHASE3 domain-containing protein [Cyclobacteriaceae bacterium]